MKMAPPKFGSVRPVSPVKPVKPGKGKPKIDFGGKPKKGDFDIPNPRILKPTPKMPGIIGMAKGGTAKKGMSKGGMTKGKK